MYDGEDQIQFLRAYAPSRSSQPEYAVEELNLVMYSTAASLLHRRAIQYDANMTLPHEVRCEFVHVGLVIINPLLRTSSELILLDIAR
jgi:hypothetical protein